MRKKMRSNISVKYSYILIFLFILIFLNITLAQAKQLDILITDLNGEEINEIYENEYFKISVLDFDQNGTPYVIDVNGRWGGKCVFGVGVKSIVGMEL